MNEAVYMTQPKGFKDKNYPNYVCKLSKALYGLKQDPRAWNDNPRTIFLSWGFTHVKSDNSLFCFKIDSLTLLVLVYIDDIFVTGNDEAFIRSFIEKLNKVFSIKDLGDLHFLGFEVYRDNIGIYLSQTLPKFFHLAIESNAICQISIANLKLATNNGVTKFVSNG